MFTIPFFLHLAIISSTTLLHALGYNVVLGRARILHFGPVTCSIVSAYGTFLLLRQTGSWTLALTGGLTLTLGASLVLATLSRRLPADAFGVFSIAVHLATLTIVMNWTTVTRGALGLSGLPRLPGLQTDTALALCCVGIAAVWVFMLYVFDRSRHGRALRALGENGWFGQAIGLSITRLYTLAFLVAGIGAFMGNVLYHQYLYLVHPDDLDFPVLIFYVMVVVAGKPGSVLGVTASTIGLTLLDQGIRFLPLTDTIKGPLPLVIFGCILFWAVWLRRDSLFPVKRSI